jgi:8-oxo-dGTP diphosphatase
MKKLLFLAGTLVFWLGWPYWRRYFKIHNRRSRVIVRIGDQILLVRDWLGRGEWGLPGGGANLHESGSRAAVRELQEEVGIVCEESALKPFGSRMHAQAGLRYQANYFLLELVEKPSLQLRRSEIADARWVTFEEARQLRLNQDAAHIVARNS